MSQEKYKEKALSLFERKFINWPTFESIIMTWVYHDMY